MLTKDQIIEALKTVKDPEVGLDIWTMGLIYDIEINKTKKQKNKDEHNVKILMTYTTPFCPWGPQLNDEVTTVLTGLGIKKVEIEITFEPPYKMPEELRVMMGI